MPVPLDQSLRTMIHARGCPAPTGVPATKDLASCYGCAFDTGKTRSQPRSRFVQLARNGMLGCVIAFGGSLALPTEGLAIDPQYRDEFVVDGVARSLKSWWYAFRDCERNSDIEKGEYETREEFEARRAELARNCETMWPLKNAVATYPVSLSYNSDSETFSFTVDLGSTGMPKDLGLAYKPNDPEFWRRMCDLDLACEEGGNQYFRTVCWMVDPDWLDNFRVNKSANMAFVDAEPGISVWQVTDENLWATERAEETCNFRSANDYRLQVSVRADIDKARRMKTMEPSLRLEFSGRSQAHYRGGARFNESYWIFHISGIRLVNQEDGSEIFALKR